MKKITFLFVLLFTLLSLDTNAQITSYPYFEDFESGDGGWVADNTTNGTWALGAPTGAIINSAASGTNAWVTNLSGTYNTSENSWVTSPVFDLSSLAAPSIELSIWYDAENSWDGAVLQSSIDAGASWQNVGAMGDPNNWYNDGTINGNPGGQQEGWTGTGTSGTNAWVIARHALVGLGGESNVILRVAFGSDTSVVDEGFAFDDINIFDVSCPEPIALTLGTFTENSAEFTWQQGGTETSWEIAIQPQGTGVPTGSGVATSTNNPHVENGLTPTTAYEVYVRANCGSEFSAWVGPLNFTTLNTPPPPPNGVTCASGSSSFIFIEDFETDPAAGWTGTPFSGNNGDWHIVPGNANSGGTGPNASHSGGMHLEYEASGNSTDIASAISPAIDLSTATDGAELSFFMHAFGDDMGLLNVGISTNAAGPFTNLYSWNGNFQIADTDAWVPIGINLDAYLGQVVYIEFSYGGAGSGFEGDMSIDFMRVESCGSFCIAPNPINVTNITGTTADLDWVANNGEGEWEYVVQPAGTGEPTGNGTVTTSNTINLTGLDYSTDYEVYVRANCGSEYSVWGGPVNFTTTIQTLFDVDCSVGPATMTYCYPNNDTNVFVFTSTDGTPLNITFNAGQVENGWDELIVYDTDGTTELYNGYGNAGDVTGLTFQSTGDSISFAITSDGSVNCEGNGFTPIDVTVACATCINPEANYLVVDDCANGDQFLIDVDVTDMGDATTLTISDNQGSTPVNVTTTGVTQFGPYPFGVDIIISIENADDSNCIITSPAIQQLACPPDNDNPCDATVATVNDNESCDILNPGSLIAASDSGVPAGTCAGNPNDDVWYEFTALAEAQLISIVNIQGGTTNLDHAVYEGTCDNLVELYCSGDDASVTPQLVIGNTYFVRIFSAGADEATSTFDLCIKEAPANINCESASNFCSNGDALYGSNVIGIPNSADVACLGSIPNPSWNVIQIGESGPIEIQIVQNTEFDDDGNPIGTGLDVDFVLWGPFDNDTDYCELDLLVDCPTCPNNTTDPDFYPFNEIVDCSYSADDVENVTIANAIEGEIYVLLVTNFSDQPGTIQIQQTNADDGDSGSITAEIEADLGEDQNLCGFPDYTITVDSPFADTYQWFQNGILMADETGDTLVVTESDTYTVIVYNEQCDTSAQDEVTINFYQDANANPVDDIVTCDDPTGDEIEDFDLEIQTAGILGTQDPADFVVTYHASLADAQNGVNALISPYNNISNPQTIYARIEDTDAVNSNSGCFAVTNFDLVISGPTPTATSVNFEVCDDMSRDGTELFDLDSHSANILDGQNDTDFTVTYYATQTDADAAVNPLASPYENTSNPQTIYARVESNVAFDCYATAAFDLIVNEVPYTTFADDVVYEVCPNATVPIEVIAIAENYTESEVSISWYQDGVLIPGANSLILPVLVEGTYTIEVIFNDTTCIYEESVNVTQLETCVIPEGISPNGDGFNDTFDLSSYDVQSLEIFNRHGVLVYSKSNYTDEWVGQSDNGDKLPVGTYFYVMKYQEDKLKTAWIYLNY
jgi:gliding motility-associated-like protein